MTQVLEGVRLDHLYGVLLQVEVSGVDGDAVGHLVQTLAGADDSRGLVGAGAERGAGLARRGGAGAPHGLRPGEQEQPREQLGQQKEQGGGAGPAGQRADAHGNWNMSPPCDPNDGQREAPLG